MKWYSRAFLFITRDGLDIKFFPNGEQLETFLFFLFIAEEEARRE